MWRRLIPTREQMAHNRWLRWLGPRLFDPALWHWRRRTLALGVALGVFFGLLIPVAQIPVSAAAAVVLRANVPAAVASTLVTNPVTFAPVYYAAWKLGSALLGEPHTPPPTLAAEPGDERPWWQRLWTTLTGVGKPLALGLLVLAVGAGLITYYAIAWVWALRIGWQRWRRKRGR